MKKNKFISLLRAPDKIGEKEVDTLRNLVSEFPYSQSLHVMLAKGAMNCSHADAEKMLNHAAVYTADRKNLKRIIEDTKFSPSTETYAGEDFVDESDDSNNEKLKRELTTYIEKLRTEKLNLQFQVDEGVSEEAIEERNNFVDALDQKILEAEAKLARLDGREESFSDEGITAVDDEDASADENSQGAEAKNDVVDEFPENEKSAVNPVYDELEENLNALKNYRENNPEESDDSGTKMPSETITTLSNNVERERMEEYLASLKATDEETISNEKLREQITIINRFIENEPKLSRLELEEGSQSNRVDLSLKSLKVHQNIASENLARIMAKQGKLDKAEEIYNKLIWKFPEKKAYFVAQIEELKKK